jgi:DNA-binding MarR family transcriptional regulator
MKPMNKNNAFVCPWGNIDDEDAALELEDYPSVMLLRLANSIQQKLSSRYAGEHDFTPSEWRVMARLSKASPMQFTDLCRTAAMDKAYVSRMVRMLETRGLVSTAGDPDHKRRVVVSITQKGRALTRQVFPQAEKSQFELLATLTSNERITLYKALKKLQSHVDNVEMEKGLAIES